MLGLGHVSYDIKAPLLFVDHAMLEDVSLTDFLSRWLFRR